MKMVVRRICACHPDYINLSMNGLLGVEDYFKFFLPDDYEEEDEKITNTLVSDFNINTKYSGDILLLFLSYRNVLKISQLAFQSALQQQELNATAKKLDAILKDCSFSITEGILTKAIAALEGHLLHTPNKPPTKPKQIEAELIRDSAALAQFLWFSNLIPGKGDAPSKDSVYRFIFDFIRACGFTFPPGYTPSNVKDQLKQSLQSMDSQKIHPKYEL